MNEVQLKTAAVAVMNRVNQLGFRKGSSKMVVDQAYEVVAASLGMRNQHVLRQKIKKEDVNKPKASLANPLDLAAKWQTLLTQTGWNDTTVLHLAKDFLSQEQLWGKFVSFCETQAHGTLPDSFSEVITQLSELLSPKGYSVQEREDGIWTWTGPDEDESCDFHSEESAWLDLIATISRNQIDPDELAMLEPSEQAKCILDAVDAQQAQALEALEATWGAEHPFYTKDDWKFDIQNGDTSLGYWQWVQHQLNSKEHCDCGAPLDNDGDSTCKSCSKGQPTLPDEQILRSETEYSFYIGAMTFDQLQQEMDLRGICADFETKLQCRDALLQWYSDECMKQVIKAFEPFKATYMLVTYWMCDKSGASENTFKATVVRANDDPNDQRKWKTFRVSVNALGFNNPEVI